MKVHILINSINELESSLSKAQLVYLRDKAQKAIDAYAGYMIIRETNDSESMEEVYVTFFLIIYRSIFGKNNVNNRKTFKINYNTFMQPSPIPSIEKEYTRITKNEHDYYLGLVDELFAHTDLDTKEKKVEIKNYVKPTATSMEVEELYIPVDTLGNLMNMLGTVFYNLEALIDNRWSSFIHCRYNKGSWQTLSVTTKDNTAVIK